MAEVRWMLTEQREQSSLPMPFFVMLVFWLVIIFHFRHDLSPEWHCHYRPVCLCFFRAAGALYMISELDRPYMEG